MRWLLERPLLVDRALSIRMTTACPKLSGSSPRPVSHDDVPSRSIAFLIRQRVAHAAMQGRSAPQQYFILLEAGESLRIAFVRIINLSSPDLLENGSKRDRARAAESTFGKP
eukprot:scaffold138589_cov18-Prasinocladus_malaysianus.AAC.1